MIKKEGIGRTPMSAEFCRQIEAVVEEFKASIREAGRYEGFRPIGEPVVEYRDGALHYRWECEVYERGS